ncbi:hypothetical protein GF362_04735 [Candidatus Dojkabacteria bacterium]|nr:hypothetical protein [Candidatus Dojkabacteria bacterium]
MQEEVSNVPGRVESLTETLSEKNKEWVLGQYSYMNETVTKNAHGREPSILYTLAVPIMFKQACKDYLTTHSLRKSPDFITQECIDSTLAVLLVDELIESELERGIIPDPETIVASSLRNFGDKPKTQVPNLKNSLELSAHSMLFEDYFVRETERGDVDLSSFEENMIISGSLHVIFDILDQHFDVSTESESVYKLCKAFRYLCEIGSHGKDRKELLEGTGEKSPFGNLINARAYRLSRESGRNRIDSESVLKAENYYKQEYERIMYELESNLEFSPSLEILTNFVHQFSLLTLGEETMNFEEGLEENIAGFYSNLNQVVERFNKDKPGEFEALNRYLEEEQSEFAY